VISDEAARALGLISGIDLCKQADADFWRGMVTRIVVDLDEEPGAEREMVRVRELLADMWRKLPDKKVGIGTARETTEVNDG
jgi:hypothetical protein